MDILITVVIFFVAMVAHEFSHALVAFAHGDQTARQQGRLTLNPLAHIDPFGTIILPAFLILVRAPVLFGWAKPVPINFSQLRHPKQDMILVGIAGPMANFLLALAAALFIKFAGHVSPAALTIALQFLLINTTLAVFNLFPLPPLDGSRVLMGLLPMPAARALARLEPYGFIILFALLYMGLLDGVLWPLSKTIAAGLLSL
jgi:Zn-dependent protease